MAIWLFGIVVGIFGGWWFLEQPKWAKNLKEDLYAWFRKQ